MRSYKYWHNLCVNIWHWNQQRFQNLQISEVQVCNIEVESKRYFVLEQYSGMFPGIALELMHIISYLNYHMFTVFLFYLLKTLFSLFESTVKCKIVRKMFQLFLQLPHAQSLFVVAWMTLKVYLNYITNQFNYKSAIKLKKCNKPFRWTLA